MTLCMTSLERDVTYHYLHQSFNKNAEFSTEWQLIPAYDLTFTHVFIRYNKINITWDFGK